MKERLAGLAETPATARQGVAKAEPVELGVEAVQAAGGEAGWVGLEGPRACISPR